MFQAAPGAAAEAGGGGAAAQATPEATGVWGLRREGGVGWVVRLVVRWHFRAVFFFFLEERGGEGGMGLTRVEAPFLEY